jgi:hypothetical protein
MKAASVRKLRLNITEVPEMTAQNRVRVLVLIIAAVAIAMVVAWIGIFGSLTAPGPPRDLAYFFCC